MSMISAEDLATHIPYGKDKAVSREFLCMLFGISDRAVRRLVHDARDAGHIIINDQTGAGYYRSDDPKDIIRQYRQNKSRALAILAQQKHLRRRLKDAGVEV